MSALSDLYLLTTDAVYNIVYFQACDRLLAHRVEQKMKSRKVNDVVNRLHVSVPAKRDDKVFMINGVFLLVTDRATHLIRLPVLLFRLLDCMLKSHPNMKGCLHFWKSLDPFRLQVCTEEAIKQRCLHLFCKHV